MFGSSLVHSIQSLKMVCKDIDNKCPNINYNLKYVWFKSSTFYPILENGMDLARIFTKHNPQINSSSPFLSLNVILPSLIQ